MEHRIHRFGFLLSLALACFAVPLAHAASLESANLALSITAAPDHFSFQFVNKANNSVVLSSSSTGFGAAGVIGVNSTVLGNDGLHDFVDLNFALADSGTATGRFTLTSPTTVQVDLMGPAATSAISQMFTDNGERYYGTWQSLFGKNLNNRNLNQVYDGTSLNSTSVEGSRAPFYFTSNNVGVYTQTDTTGSYQFAVSGQSGFTFNTTDGSGTNTALRYTVMVGNSPKEVLKQFNTVAGPSFMPPTWAFDSIWWRDDHHQIPSQAGVTTAQGLVIKDADMLRQLHIPSGAIWVDRPYGTGTTGLAGWGNFDFDSSFPNPAQLVADLDARGMNLLLWIANRASNDMKTEATANGWLVPSSNATPAVDLRIPAAYDWFQNKLDAFVDLGIKGYKIDRGGEGEMPKLLQNKFSPLFTKLAFDGMQAQNGDDFFIFGRNGADQARRNIGIWNGDVAALFSGLQTSIKHSLRSGLVGFPMWGSDTGGYNGTPTKELFARWLQFSTYCPMMEVLSGPNRNVWYNYDQQLIDIAVKQTQAHHDMIPYVRSGIAESMTNGLPVMRALFLEFPDDPLLTDMWDEYLYGPNLLVAPVTVPGATSRLVYLPAGRWVDFNDKSRVFEGTIEANAPLDVIPVYAREGAIIPRGDIVEGNQAAWKPNWSASLTIDVFPSDQFASSFDYYTDSGAIQTILCQMSGNTLHIEFADLEIDGELQLYLGRFFDFPGLAAVTLNGILFTGYAFDPNSDLLTVPFSGATSLHITMVPEPSSGLLAACSFLALCLARARGGAQRPGRK